MRALKKHWSLLVLIGILFLSFSIRIYHTQLVPASLNIDEAALGYNAYSILRTGKDEHGIFLPVSFKSFGDYKLPVYIYLDTIPIALFGLQATAIRLPSIVAGVISTYLIFSIAYTIFKKKQLALLSALLFALCPWSIYFSRVAYEANVATMLFLGGLLAFLYALNNKRVVQSLIISSLLFGLTMFTYHAYIFFTPLFVIALSILWHRQISMKRLVVFIGVFVLCLGIAYPTIIAGSIQKGTNVGIFNNQSIIYNRVDSLRGDNAAEPKLFQVVLHNKYFGVSYQILQNYFNSFSPQFLFDKGGEKLAHNLGSMGNLYAFDALLLFVGVCMLFWNREKRALLLFVPWLILSPLPSAITEDAPNSARLIMMMPLCMLLAGYGFYTLLSYLNSYAFLGRIGITVLILLYTLNVLFYLEIYFYHMNIHRGRFVGDGYQQAVMLSQQYPDKQVVMRGPENFPYIYFLVYTTYDPHKFFSEASYYPPTKEGFSFVKQFGKYEFVDTIDYGHVRPNTIYIDDTRLDDKRHDLYLQSGDPKFGYLITE